MRVLFVPLSSGTVVTLLQFTVAIPLVFCCKRKSVEGEVQETATVLVVVRRILKAGTGIYFTVAKSEC